MALEMKVTGSKGSAVIRTENKIRSALGGNGYKIQKQDGTEAASAKLLPSAFYSRKAGEVFTLKEAAMDTESE